MHGRAESIALDIYLYIRTRNLGFRVVEWRGRSYGVREGAAMAGSVVWVG
jgi:hypothetical protein